MYSPVQKSFFPFQLTVRSAAATALFFLFSIFEKNTFAQQRQPDLVSIEHFSLENGLSSRDLGRAALHPNGFLWLSTRHGMSRFDGRQFKNFASADLGIENVTGFFLDFALDPHGHFWLMVYGNKSGNNKFVIKIFDPETEKSSEFDEVFGAIAPFRGSEIDLFLQDPQSASSLLVVLTDKRVFRFDDDGFHPLLLPEGLDARLNVFRVAGRGDHLFWQDFQNYFESDAAGKTRWSSPTQRQLFSSIFEGQNGSFYMTGKFRYGKLRPESNILFRKLPGKPPEPLPLFLNGRVLSPLRTFDAKIEADGSGWGFAEQFIYRFDEQQQVFQVVDLAAEMPVEQLPTVGSLAVQDGGRIVWAATNEGLFKLCFSPQKFRTYLPKHSVRGMLRLGDSLLINTYNGQHIYRFSNQNVAPSTLPGTYGLGMASTSGGHLFIGRDATSISRLRLSDSKIDEFVFSDSFMTTAKALPFFDQKTGRLWVGCSDGVYFSEKQPDAPNLVFRRLESHPALFKNFVRHISRHSDGLWMAGTAGISLLDERDNVIFHLNKKSGLPANEVRWIHEDAAGIFWIATSGGGLVRWDKKTNPQPVSPTDFQIFDQKTGLPNDYIYSIHEDRHGFLWLPTDRGLVRFDKISHRVQVFNQRDGLAHEEFNYLAQFQTEKNIFLGGLNGLTVFNPDDFLNFSEKNKPLRLVGLSVFDGKTEHVEDRTLQILRDQTILLDADDRFLEAKFALLDFVAPDQNRYAYFIEGFEKDWNLLKNNEIRVSGLPPGNYRLRVRAQGGDGQWSSDEINLPLVVRAPFWLRWQFWAISTFVAALIFYFYLQYRTRKLLRDREKLEREVAARTETIRQQAEALQSLDRAKSRFFENITHEFRTPLTLILSPLRELLRRRELTFGNPKLDLARSNGERLLGLVNQLLDLAKLESDRLELHFRWGNVLPILHEVFAQFLPSAEQKNVCLTWDCELPELMGIADRNVLERVVTNLLSNALKFTPTGGRVQMKIEKNAANELQISVSDSGIGIVAADLPHVFDRFFQADNSSTRRHEGTGIGLSLVKELVERVDGSIWVESEIGVGTSFFVRLPLVLPVGFDLEKNSSNVVSNAVEVVNLDEVGKKRPDLEDEFWGEQPSILLVEDNPEMREYLHLVLSDGGFAVVEAENGAIGTTLARKMIPDLIVSDVMMPEKNGFELTAELKNDPLTSHIPIVLLTAKGQTESRIEGYRRGADAYLPKPFEVEELLVRLRGLLDVRRRWQAKFQFSPEAVAANWQMEAAEKSDAAADAEAMLSRFDVDFLQRMHAHIRENLADENLLAENLASDFYMSRTQFFAKVKALTGLPPGSLIRNIRLDAAYALFEENPNLKIADVAQRVGFGDARNFSQVFKKRYGKSPQEVGK